MSDQVKYGFEIDTVDAGNLTKLQDRAIRSAHNARINVQIALVATVAHLYKYHDVRVARRLVEGLQDTVRSKAMIEYLCRYGYITVGKVDVDGKSVTTFSAIIGNAEEHAEAIRQDFEAAKEKMWWELARNDVNKFKGWSLDEALQKLIEKNKKQMKKAAEHPELAAQIDVEVNDKTIQALLNMCHFDALIEDKAA